MAGGGRVCPRMLLYEVLRACGRTLPTIAHENRTGQHLHSEGRPRAATEQSAVFRRTLQGTRNMKNDVYTPEWFLSHNEYRDDYRAVADIVAVFGDQPERKCMDVGCGLGLILER